MFRLDTPGGGGYGDPRAREPERVLADVRDGYISAAAAERGYGVVVVESAHGLAIDTAATELRRNTDKGKEKP